jgi:hypothetical protein
LAFSALTIIFAKFWLKMNISPWDENDLEGLLEFPKQMLFMHYGPWMSWPMLFVHLPIIILCGVWLKIALPHSERPESLAASVSMPAAVERCESPSSGCFQPPRGVSVRR